jgi:hypothetical protein
VKEARARTGEEPLRHSYRRNKAALVKEALPEKGKQGVVNGKDDHENAGGGTEWIFFTGGKRPERLLGIPALLSG